TLGALPWATLTSAIATLLVVIFFVTSADSGALVIDMITNGNAENPPLWQRVFWAVGSGAVAAVLLLTGGLEALQTAAIVSALPLAVAMVFICYGLPRALQREGEAFDSHDPAPATQPRSLRWQQRLQAMVS